MIRNDNFFQNELGLDGQTYSSESIESLFPI